MEEPKKVVPLLTQIAEARMQIALLRERISTHPASKTAKGQGDAIRSSSFDSSKPTFAVIFDEFTRDCFAPDLNLVEISRNKWKEEIQSAPVQALMVESAWVGNSFEWKYCVANLDIKGNPLRAVINYCKERGIPTIFWNKEDPVHFRRFSNTAKLFDVIFTTDAGSIPKYEELTGKPNAFLLPFAAQPAIHNPVRYGTIKDRVAFAGAWRGIKYPWRGEALDMLLSTALEQGIVDIFDRVNGTTNNPDLVFPNKFQKAIVGSLPYEELVQTAYRNYLAFVNVNSVENSDTMLARRVFELLACGTPVISSYSRAIEKTFGDTVIMPKTSKEAADAIEKLRTDPIFRPSLAARGVRQVHSQHTVQRRIDTILTTLGMPAISKSQKRVTLICNSKRPGFLKHVASQIRAQTYREREVIFVAHNESYKEDQIAEAFEGEDRFRLLRNDPDLFLADGLNAALAIADGDLFAKIDDDDYYGPHYIEDSVRCFDYARGAAIVGKHSYFAYIETADQTVLRFPNKYYRFTNHVAGATLVCDRKYTDGVQFQRVQRGTDSIFLKDCADRDVPIFSSDPFNYLHVRYAEPGQHTWNITDEEFASKTMVVGNGRLDDRIFI